MKGSIHLPLAGCFLALCLAACSATPPATTTVPPVAADSAPPTSAALPEDGALREGEETPDAAGEGSPAGTPAIEAGATTADRVEDPTLVRLNPKGETRREPMTLVEAARRAREQRQKSEKKPVKVITNENLSEFAAGGQVTFAPEPAGGEPGGEGPEMASGADEAYWRSAVRRLRLDWAEAVAKAEELEQEVADLRWQFYAADDPFVRDQRIKPQWDRAIDELRGARVDSQRFRDELAETLEAGRTAGALPGWLRDGIELEPEMPESENDPEPSTQQPVPPPVYNPSRN